MDYTLRLICAHVVMVLTYPVIILGFLCESVISSFNYGRFNYMHFTRWIAVGKVDENK